MPIGSQASALAKALKLESPEAATGMFKSACSIIRQIMDVPHLGANLQKEAVRLLKDVHHDDLRELLVTLLSQKVGLLMFAYSLRKPIDSRSVCRFQYGRIHSLTAKEVLG